MTAHRGKRISEAEFRRLWFDRSLTAAQIGKMLGITQSAVAYRAKARGLPPRGNSKERIHAFQGKRIDALRALWAAGVRRRDIADAFGVHENTVGEAVVRLGLPPRGKASSHKAITLAEYNSTILLPQAMKARARAERKAWKEEWGRQAHAA